MTLFYDRLFAVDSSTRPLFAHADMAAQRAKLAQAIALSIDGLDRLGDMMPLLAELGRRHAAYGVCDEHYDSVGAALLWTLERGLGEAWTPEVEAAWVEAYGTLAGAMRQAA